MGRRSRPASALAIAVLAAWLGAAAAPAAGAVSISLEEKYPLREQPVTLRVQADDGAPVSGVTVIALYRPNSQTSFEEVLPATGDDGTLLWSPRDAGIVTLSAHPAPPAEDGTTSETLATLDVAVRFGDFPASGQAIMLLAALVLFGGASFGFFMLFKR